MARVGSACRTNAGPGASLPNSDARARRADGPPNAVRSESSRRKPTRLGSGSPARDESPREQPAAAVLISSLPARDFCQGESPEAATCRAGPPRPRLEKRQAQRHAGPSRRKRRRYLAEGESSEGRIPGAPPVRNKAGAEPEGESRREGNQTLGTDPSGQVRPAASGSRVPDVLKGSEVQERRRPGENRPAR